jgi:hypothetical protein
MQTVTPESDSPMPSDISDDDNEETDGILHVHTQLEGVLSALLFHFAFLYMLMTFAVHDLAPPYLR